MTENKKILVLFTGGTIGSSVQGSTINVDISERFRLIDEYKKLYGSKNFECFQLFNILSENIGFEHWEKLIAYLLDIDTDSYKGIIITHGSDTLSYTSALLGMFFRHIEIPVFIIASNKPLGEVGSNGLFNFSAAVELIEKGGIHGVFTLYEKVMLPTRVIPADTYCDKFSVYGDNGIDDSSVFRGVTAAMIERKHKQMFFEPISFKKQIMIVHGYPAADYSCFAPSKDTAAVLFCPYHSATACTNSSLGENYSFLHFIERCIMNNIMVYICGVKPDSIHYETLDKIIKAGSIPLFSICEPAAYMKLLIAYNQSRYKVGELMNKNLYFEIVGKNIK
ncbi:MAG: asparaginase [Ruminococcus sp.]|nr:asparaginase [Ruminococcus sp.]MBR1753079.1 asparaginase [Ruminococcus sp.]